jgi:spoIIIJ-associated protein
VESREKRSVVARGKTVEDAITNGLAILGVRRDQVDIDIIHPGSRGLLGIGAEDAQVKLVVKAPPKPATPPPAPAPEPQAAPQPLRPAPERTGRPGPRPERTTPPAPAAPPVPTAKPAARADGPEHAEKGERGASPEEVAEAGRDILSRLLAAMGFDATVDATYVSELADEGEEPPLVLNIRGDDLGILIGRRGETLAALQYLVRLMVSHRVKHWSDLLVDVESYRTRRRRALETLAARVAERAVASGHTQALEPMPAYERRLVHIALRNHPLVTTHSIGIGEKRKVTIIPKKP